MSFPPIPLADSVDVPLSEGVPALLGKSAAKSAEAVASGFAGSALEAWKVQRARKGWGIFDSLTGQRVLGASSIEMVGYQKAYNINSAPQEDGAFISTDKVSLPGQGTMRLICDGSETGILSSTFSIPGLSNPHGVKADFLATLDKIAGGTSLYIIRVPEYDYMRMNVTTYNIERHVRSGVSMIIADIHLVEARSSVTKGFTNTVNPSGAAVIDGGYKQAQTS